MWSYMGRDISGRLLATGGVPLRTLNKSTPIRSRSAGNPITFLRRHYVTRQEEDPIALREEHYFESEGHVAYQQGDFDKALSAYKRLHEFRPRDPTALSLLAMTYEKMEDWDNALSTSDRALSLYEDQNMREGIIAEKLRTGRAYESLCKFEDAQKSFYEAISEGAPTWTYAVQHLTELETVMGVTSKRRDFVYSELQAQEVYYKQITKDLPISIEYATHLKGRGLFATRDFEQGEVVFSEEPLVIVPDFVNEELPCFEGPEIQIDPKIQYHPKFSEERVSMVVKDLLEELEYPKLDVQTCQNCNIQFSNKEVEIQAREGVLAGLCNGNCGDNARLKALLPTIFDFDKTRVDERDFLNKHRESAVISVLTMLLSLMSKDMEIWDSFVQLLVFHEKVPERLLTDSEEKYLVLLQEQFPDFRWLLKKRTFLRLLSAVKLNLFSVEIEELQANIVKEKEDILHVDGEEKDPKLEVQLDLATTIRGHGLYKICSFMNHSCDPNMELKHPAWDGKITWMATRDIKKGEELTFAYIGEMDSQEERRQLLKDHYGFACQGTCSLCQQDDTPSLQRSIEYP